MTVNATEDSGGLDGDGRSLQDLISDHGWTRSRLIAEMRKVARQQGRKLPGDESLKRMIRMWVNGTRRPNEDYSALLRHALGVGGIDSKTSYETGFLDLLDRGDAVDQRMVELLLEQTQLYRVMDRKVGAKRLLLQTEHHAIQMADYVQWAPFGKVRNALAAGTTAAMCLAGWQALDLGAHGRAWKMYSRATLLGQESGDISQYAHSVAAQAYVLLDLRRYDRAVQQFSAARAIASGKAPGITQSWLCAAEAEARAAKGDRGGSLELLDKADRLLNDDAVPGLFLDATHLARWRGHCLARLGDDAAIDVLSRALTDLPKDFARAAAALHIDLATAYSVQGQRDAAESHAQSAQELGKSVQSVRQLTRLQDIIKRQQVQDGDQTARVIDAT